MKTKKQYQVPTTVIHQLARPIVMMGNSGPTPTAVINQGGIDPDGDDPNSGRRGYWNDLEE